MVVVLFTKNMFFLLLTLCVTIVYDPTAEKSHDGGMKSDAPWHYGMKSNSIFWNWGHN